MSLANVTTSWIRRRRVIAAGVFVMLTAIVLGPLGTEKATARLVRDKDAKVSAPRGVFGRIGVAWEAGDERTLANLIHEDGLRVTMAGGKERVSHYSPSQAHYFFRNLFQSHRTILFEFEMMQDATAGARVYGLAVWKRRRPDSENVEVIKLVCILAQQDDQWKLAEINTIR